MILYIYTNAPAPSQACATTLADLQALIAALADPQADASLATLGRIQATIEQIVLNDHEDLTLYFYDSASAEASWPADAAESVAVSLGLLRTDGSQALATALADTIVSTHRTGNLALTTAELKAWLEGWAPRGQATLQLQIRRTDATGHRTTYVLMPVTVSKSVLNSATTAASGIAVGGLDERVEMPATTAADGKLGQFAVDEEKLAIYVPGTGWVYFTGYQV